MRVNPRIIWTFGAAIACGTSFALPQNSYIVKPVVTPNDLAQQVASNPTVADRYERHFGMSKGEVIDYIKSLKPGKLKETGMYTVWNVPAKTGELRTRILRMTAGTPVFVDWNDRPVMVRACGNPMIPGRSMATTNELVADVSSTVVDSVAEIATPAAPITESPIVVREPAVPDLQPEPEVTVATPRQRNNGALLLIPLLGAAFIKTGKTTPEPEPNPVPEPATIIAIGSGLAAMTLRRRPR